MSNIEEFEDESKDIVDIYDNHIKHTGEQIPLAPKVKEFMVIEGLLREAFVHSGYKDISKNAKALVDNGVTVARIEELTEKFKLQHEKFSSAEFYERKDHLWSAFSSLGVYLKELPQYYPTAEQIIEETHFDSLVGAFMEEPAENLQEKYPEAEQIVDDARFDSLVKAFMGDDEQMPKASDSLLAREDNKGIDRQL